MSFPEEKREKIKRYILEKIFQHRPDIAKKTAQAFGISLNTVYRYIRELEQDGMIEKVDNSFRLTMQREFFALNREKNELTEEDMIYDRCIEKFMDGLPDNVRRIWQYSFMEMMNNAIEHSGAEHVFITVRRNYLMTLILISDDGIGIFRKIREYYQYPSLDDAVNELFKGKLTTDSTNHSGEGIFFTSRILDRFAAISDGKIFAHDNYFEKLKNMEEVESLKRWKDHKGTSIYMGLSNFSNKALKEVFDMFSDEDGGFTKTNIPVKNLFADYPVSRSQARRLCSRFETFNEVELDFKEVDEIGQGFAHEIFVVFQNRHTGVNLIPLNMTPAVEKMIHHVRMSAIKNDV